MSICDKCVYSGHCLLEVSSVPAKCNMFHDKKELGMTEEQRIDLEYLHRSSKRRTDPEYLMKIHEQDIADRKASAVKDEKRKHEVKIQMWILAACLSVCTMLLLAGLYL